MISMLLKMAGSYVDGINIILKCTLAAMPDLQYLPLNKTRINRLFYFNGVRLQNRYQRELQILTLKYFSFPYFLSMSEERKITWTR